MYMVAIKLRMVFKLWLCRLVRLKFRWWERDASWILWPGEQVPARLKTFDAEVNRPGQQARAAPFAVGEQLQEAVVTMELRFHSVLRTTESRDTPVAIW